MKSEIHARPHVASTASSGGRTVNVSLREYQLKSAAERMLRPPRSFDIKKVYA